MTLYNPKRLECIKELIKTARESKFSTLRKLAKDDQDIYDVWDNVSQIIEYHMNRRKAVQVPGLGTFTFTSSKLDIGHNKFILIQRPVFILSENLARTHRLTQCKYHVPGEIPVIQLNFTALSYELNMDRDFIEASIKEVVNALSRGIEKNGAGEFGLTTVGNLIIHNGNAKMKFLPSFVDQLDQTGGLAKFLSKRPESSNSLHSSKSSLVLPKIVPGEELKSPKNKAPDMVSIQEEQEKKTTEEAEEEGLDNKDITTDRSDMEHSTKSENVRSSKAKRENITAALKIETSNAPVVQDISLSMKDISITGTNPTSHPRNSFKGKKTVSYKNPQNEIHGSTTKMVPLPSRSCDLDLSGNVSKPKPSQVLLKSAPTYGPSTCSNCTENMSDFCYLCFQREKRNQPIYCDKRKEEQEEDRLLQMYALLKDSKSLLKEQEKDKEKRAEAQRIALFNLSVSEQSKEQKESRPEDYHRSYVFRQRVITPPHSIKEENYKLDLADQVNEKAKRLKKEKLSKDSMERVEQLQLAENLAAQRNQYLKSKRLQSDVYRKALDTQLYIKKCLEEKYEESQNDRRIFSVPRPNIVLPFQQDVRVQNGQNLNTIVFRSSELPAAYPDSDNPIFGIYDTTEERKNDRRKRARNLYLNQVQMTAEKCKNNLVREYNRKREEEEMLRNTKNDLLQETMERTVLNLKQRQDLEKTWAAHATSKRSKEIEEKIRARSPGLLLQEQCAKYKICDQCNRKMHNHGESNVWSESRYVSGSRLMV